jgi:hypothetical protein
MGSVYSKKEIREVLDHVEAQGARIEENKSGWRIYGPDGMTANIHRSGGSDHRGRLNFNATLRRMGYTLPNERHPERREKIVAREQFKSTVLKLDHAFEQMGKPTRLSGGELASRAQVGSGAARTYLERKGYVLTGHARGAVWTHPEHAEQTEEQAVEAQVEQVTEDDELSDMGVAFDEQAEFEARAADMSTDEQAEFWKSREAEQEADPRFQQIEGNVPERDATPDEAFQLGEVSGYQQAYDELKPQIEELKAELHGRELHHFEVEEENERQKAKLREQADAFARLTEVVNTGLEENDGLRRSNERLKKENSRLQALELAGDPAYIEELQSLNAKLAAELQNAQAYADKLAAELEDERQANGKLALRNADMQRDWEDLEAQYQVTREQLRDAVAERNHVERLIEDGTWDFDLDRLTNPDDMTLLDLGAFMDAAGLEYVVRVWRKP